jgi:hypothetical protein
MHFRTRQQFPFPLADLWNACSERAYLQHKYEAMHDRATRVRQFHADAKRIDVRLERQVALGELPLPAWVRSAGHLPDVLRQQSTWQRSGPGQADVRMAIDVPGLPVHVEGTGVLRQAGAGAELAIAWETHCTMPLLGSAAERVMAVLVRHAMRSDRAFTVAYVQAWRERAGRR